MGHGVFGRVLLPRILAPALSALQECRDHQRNNKQVDCEQQSAMPGGSEEEFGKLKRHVDRTTDSCQNLGPSPLAIKPIRLNEANASVQACADCKPYQPAVMQIRSGIKEDQRVARSGVQVQMLDKPCRCGVYVLVNQREKAACCQKHHDTLECFEERHGPDRRCLRRGKGARWTACRSHGGSLRRRCARKIASAAIVRKAQLEMRYKTTARSVAGSTCHGGRR